MPHKPLTDTEIADAFRLVRHHSAVLVHPLLAELEALLTHERDTRRDLHVRQGELELQRILRGPDPDEWVPWNLDLARDIARGK